MPIKNGNNSSGLCSIIELMDNKEKFNKEYESDEEEVDFSIRKFHE